MLESVACVSVFLSVHVFELVQKISFCNQTVLSWSVGQNNWVAIFKVKVTLRAYIIQYMIICTILSVVCTILSVVCTMLSVVFTILSELMILLK